MNLAFLNRLLGRCLWHTFVSSISINFEFYYRYMTSRRLDARWEDGFDFIKYRIISHIVMITIYLFWKIVIFCAVCWRQSAIIFRTFPGVCIFIARKKENRFRSGEFCGWNSFWCGEIVLCFILSYPAWFGENFFSSATSKSASSQIKVAISSATI